jgi:hypothetical protein
MNAELLRQSLTSLTQARGPKLELGIPWPRDQGYDDYESPTLVHAAAQELGGQALLTGDADLVEQFLGLAKDMAEPRIIAFWMRESTFFANDGGVGLQRLARSWVGHPDVVKRYIADHADFLIEQGSQP